MFSPKNMSFQQKFLKICPTHALFKRDSNKYNLILKFWKSFENSGRFSIFNGNIHPCSVNHQWLEEVCIQFGNLRFDSCLDYWKGGVFNSRKRRRPSPIPGFNYVGQCPKLKILKIGGCLSEPIDLLSILETISSFNSNCLEELHLNFPKLAPRGSSILFNVSDRQSLKNVLKKIIENLPKMKYLCLFLDFENCHIYPGQEICQEMVSEQKIKIEMRNTINMCYTFTKK